MEQSTVKILEIAIPALSAVIVAVLGWAAKKGVNYLDAKTKVLDGAHDIQRKQHLKDSLVHVVSVVARETMQTYVKAIKKRNNDGKLTKEEASEAFKLTRDKAIKILKDQGLTVSRELLGATIEAVVGDIKPIKNSSREEN